MILKFRTMTLLAVFAMNVVFSGCGSQPFSSAEDAPTPVAPDANTSGSHPAEMAAVTSPADKRLAGFQDELLEIAFETATAIPVEPHIKDRSKAQAAVVEASLQLDQPKRALKYIERIDNWRRGAEYGDLAFYNARHGYTHDVQSYLELAAQIAETSTDWRRDRIKIKIAQTHTVLGQTELAEEFKTGVEEAESGKLVMVDAMVGSEVAFDEQVKALDEIVESGVFDLMQSAFKAYIELYKRYYNDPQRRSLIEDHLKSSWGDMPPFVKIELMNDIADSALEHGDQSKALELLQEAQGTIDNAQLPWRYRIPLQARLIKLRFRTGDKETARKNADSLRALFDEGGEGKKMVNIYRADALRPLAEAYQVMGDSATALGVYKMAVEEGVQNPNSRPRAEDLSATCLSMALYGVEPDPALWARIRQVKAGLGNPW